MSNHLDKPLELLLANNEKIVFPVENSNINRRAEVDRETALLFFAFDSGVLLFVSDAADYADRQNQK